MNFRLALMVFLIAAAAFGVRAQGSGVGGSEAKEDPLTATSLKITKKVKVAFTAKARKMKISGFLRLKVVFLASGKIGDIGYIKADPPNPARDDQLKESGMIDEAFKAAKKMEFKPATRNGAAISVSKTVEFNLDL